jgi:hypothetical protein
MEVELSIEGSQTLLVELVIMSTNSNSFCVQYEAIGLWKGMGGSLIFPVSTW